MAEELTLIIDGEPIQAVDSLPLVEIEGLKEHTIPISYDSEYDFTVGMVDDDHDLYEYYLNRKGYYYFRGRAGVLKVANGELNKFMESLKYGDKINIEFEYEGEGGVNL